MKKIKTTIVPFQQRVRSKNTKLFLSGVISLFFLGSALPVQSEPYDNIASVNNEFIIEKEFNEKLLSAKTQYQMQMRVDLNSEEGKKALNQIRKDVIEDLILTKVLLQNAAREKIVTTDDMVKKEIADIKLTSFNNNINNFKKSLQKNELSEDALHEILQEKLTIRTYLNKVFTRNIKITEADLQQAYKGQKAKFNIMESIEASHILVKDKKSADEIYRKLQKGANFAKLAQSYSLDPGSKSKGGQLGYFHKDEMVPEFEKAAFVTKVGTISKPVKTSFGYHLIKVTGYKPAKVLSFNEVKAELNEKIKDEKQRDFFTKWKETALKENEVKYYNFNIQQ